MVLLYPLVHCVLRNDIILLKDEDLEKKWKIIRIKNASNHFTQQANDRTDVHVYNSKYGNLLLPTTLNRAVLILSLPALYFIYFYPCVVNFASTER